MKQQRCLTADKITLSTLSNFVEMTLTRKHTKLDSIGVDTLIKYLKMVTEAVEKEVIMNLPSKFGVIIDGWKEGTTHYIALFASYSNSSGEWKQCYNAESHKSFIGDVLELFGNPIYYIRSMHGWRTCWTFP